MLRGALFVVLLPFRPVHRVRDGGNRDRAEESAAVAGTHRHVDGVGLELGLDGLGVLTVVNGAGAVATSKN